MHLFYVILQKKDSILKKEVAELEQNDVRKKINPVSLEQNDSKIEEKIKKHL
jgi:hypothetical protein